MILKLKREIIERIKKNPLIIGQIAVSLRRDFTSMPQILKRNDPQLTQKAVLLVISQEFDLSEEELLEEVPEQLKRIRKNKACAQTTNNI